MHEAHPIPGTFTYLAWAIDTNTRGPFVRPSSSRSAFLEALTPAATQLAHTPGISRVRVFEATFIAPLKPCPKVDVILVADHADSLRSENIQEAIAHGVPEQPVSVLTAHNTYRFGDTDATHAPILLNHFAGNAHADTVTTTIRGISQWYADTLHVTNTTLLRVDQPAPWAAINYVAAPNKVVPFLLDQVLRPSFYRHVARPLNKISLTPHPWFGKTTLNLASAEPNRDPHSSEPSTDPAPTTPCTHWMNRPGKSGDSVV